MDREAARMSDPVRRIVSVAAAAVALLAATTGPAHAQTGAPTPAAARAAGPMTAPTLMDELVTLTNEERLRGGCAALETHQELMVVSVRQSHYMAATGDFGHIGWRGSTWQARSRAAGYTDAAAENIAWGFEDAGSVMDAWMASPPHRENILNCATRSLGTGVQRAADGTLYWTQVFGYR